MRRFLGTRFGRLREHRYGPSGGRSDSALLGAGLAIIAALYVLGTLGRAKQKLFWHDEIFTTVLAQLEPGPLWEALTHGVDLNPPGFYLATRVSQSIFGSGPIGTRMPAILGVLLASVGVALFVRRRHGAFAALAAALLFLTSDAYLYAYEARPYGLVLGFTGSALLSWQSAAGSHRRWFWIGCFSLSLAAAVACHYYAVLVVVPFIAGEVSRAAHRRKPDWPLWIAAICGTAPLVACWPLLSAAREYSPQFFSPPSVSDVLDSLESSLSGLIVPALAVLIVTGSGLLFGESAESAHAPPPTQGEQDEWVVAASLLMLPLLAYGIAVAWTHALLPRYYLPWTLGFSILVPMTIARWNASGHRLCLILTCVLLSWFTIRQGSSARWLVRPGPDPRTLYPTLMTESGAAPIVFGHSHVFLAAVYYAGPAVASRLVTLSWPEAPPRYDTPIRAFRKLQTTAGLHVRVEDFDAFIARHSHVLFYGPTPDALLDKIRRSGAVIVLLAEDDDGQLFPMSRPGPSRMFDVTFGPHD